jgi:hypothetical protein
MKDSVYKPDSGQLQVPVKRPKDLAAGLVTLLRELVPVEATEAAAMAAS